MPRPCFEGVTRFELCNSRQITKYCKEKRRSAVPFITGLQDGAFSIFIEKGGRLPYAVNFVKPRLFPSVCTVSYNKFSVLVLYGKKDLSRCLIGFIINEIKHGLFQIMEQMPAPMVFSKVRYGSLNSSRIFLTLNIEQAGL